MSLNIQCLVFIDSDIFQGNESKLERFCDTASFKNLKIVFSFSFNWFFVCRHLLRINSGINLICSDCSLIISIMMSWIQFNWWSNRNSTNNLWTTNVHVKMRNILISYDAIMQRLERFQPFNAQITKSLQRSGTSTMRGWALIT